MRIIAGDWKGRRLHSLAGGGMRPTTERVREAWMAAIGPRLQGARVLDLFAGSGALGLETLSRGAQEVVFVERAREALEVLHRNIRMLGAEDRCRVVRGDALAFVRRLDRHSFHLALADPPYGKGLAAALVELFGQVAFAEELWLEHRADETLPPIPGARQRRYGDTILTQIVGGE